MNTKNAEVMLESVTIRTISVGGKRFTKSLLKQVPFGYYIYHENEDGKRIVGVEKKYTHRNDYKVGAFHFDGNLLGYVNVDIDIETIKRHSLERRVKKPYYHIIWLTKEGDLKRGYINDDDINDTGIKIQQIYI